MPCSQERLDRVSVARGIYSMKSLFGRSAALALCIVCVSSLAASSEPFEPKLREFGLMIGYGENHRIPECMKNRYRFDDVTLRYGRFISDRDENAYEVGLSSQIAGKDYQAAVAVITRRHYFHLQGDTALGYDLAFGGVRLEDAVQGLATRVNFTEQVGIVLQHKTGRNSAISIQYRFSHCSNGGIRKPNVGINASVLGIGWSTFM